MSPASKSQTRVAVLGTLAEFHREPISFDLAALVRLVTELGPDFLCLEMSPQQWAEQDFRELPPEFGQALLPLAYQTDMVVVPIAEADPPPEPMVRGPLGRLLRQVLGLIVRRAPDAGAINQGWRHDLANLLYHWLAHLGGGKVEAAWQGHQHHMIAQVIRLARRDPGRRILVVVNVRHCHHLRPALSREPDLEVVPFSEL